MKGDKIGIIGETGSGKSTLIDIIMGFIQPSSGAITIDDVDLYSKIGFINSWRKYITRTTKYLFIRFKLYRKYCIWNKKR